MTQEVEVAVSWKPVFQMHNDSKWYDNAQRFATYEEAMASAQARFAVWTLPTAYDAHESTDPVNYAWVEGQGDVPTDRKEVAA